MTEPPKPWFYETDPKTRKMAKNSMPGSTGRMVARIASDAAEIERLTAEVDRLTAALAAAQEERRRLTHALQMENAEAVDALRLKAFTTNKADDREAYLQAAAKWFNDRHYRLFAALRALGDR